MSRTQTLNALTHLLETGDEADRCYVSQALGKLADQTENTLLSSKLLPYLRDKDIDVCVDAAATLGKLGGDKVTDSLLESLEKDPDGEIKTAIARALGELGDLNAVPGLIRVLENRDEGIDVIEDGWDLWWDVQLAAVKSLGQLKATAAVPNLVKTLHSDEGEDIESDILRALAEIDSKESIEALEQILKSDDPRKQRRAATALGSAHSADAIRILGRALQSPHADVRTHVVEALEKQDAKRYLPAIMLLIKDPSDQVRRAATHAATTLGEMERPTQESVDLFTGLLEDKSALVRATSLNTLANLNNDVILEKIANNNDAVERVINLIGDTDIETSTAATRLFSKLNTRDGEEKLVQLIQNLELEPAIRRQAALSLGKMEQVGPSTVIALTETLSDGEKSVRLAALSALLDSEERYVAESAESEASNDNSEEEPKPLRPIEVILAALHCEIELTEAEKQEKTSSDSDEPNETEEGADAPPAGAQEVQFSSARDNSETATPAKEIPVPDFPTSPVVSETPKESFSTLDSIAMDNVEVMLMDDEPEEESTLDLDEEAQEYLGILEQNEEVQQRRERRYKKADIYTDVRRMATTMLGRNGSDAAIDALNQALHDDDHEVRRLAADALTEAASNNPANPALLQAQGTLISQTIFGDPDIRMACIRALGQMENRAALPALRDTLEDEDTIVRMESIRALASVATSTLDADSEGHMVTHSITNNEILEEISQALTDPQPSVRKYAADAVTTLLQHGSTDPEKRPAMIQKILDAGFAGAGEQARHMGQALRLLDSEVSSEHLIPLLESMESSAERRFVIEMLEEIYQPNENLQAPEQRLLSRHAA
ncbi:MAG: hypothetical protein HOL04_08040 [Gammaproteobacteria bacterium]|jgi:HEAT repeat protein|nr:hypothetical protein [Gammaproteobacteria bacterium]MBT4608212.1 hypothetical protein [Thiotrichales bacterium]MBT3472216.1 hypothetical protein [Gammaproteobacteria bacterium]MBT3966014.1 hypothetical protein [Gammaproteobacteria bacterium]MBT4079937.1 hypothetical protein [Gammaproteobacteria bacterium]